MSTVLSRIRVLSTLPLMALLGGCNLVLINPSGDIASQQRDLILLSTVLMLLVIVPVMLLTVLFAWRYRQSNKNARYEPEWSHSTKIELAVWGAPLVIILCLGTVTWISTHALDPYKPLDRIGPDQPVAADVKPLEVEVVALDWKWLFIYPEYGIASVNEMAAPVDRPITFRITASSVMNSFFVPALAGQIYAMPGMQTKLHAVINKPGTFDGFSANYSGAGFSGMRFKFHGLSQDEFAGWVSTVRASGQTLDGPTYLTLERPSENVPVMHFAHADPKLYDRILNMCVEPGKMCMGEMMAIDDRGGLGIAGINNVIPVASLEYDKTGRRGAVFGPEPVYVAALCTTDDPIGLRAGGAAAQTPVINAKNNQDVSPAPKAVSLMTPAPETGVPGPANS